MSFKIEKIHHVAYRCKDAKETVEWYKKYLNMDFILAFAEDHVPSTKAFDPYMHVFLDAGNGNVLAFFEVPNQPEMGFDPNTPNWVQHLAMKVKDRNALRGVLFAVLCTILLSITVLLQYLYFRYLCHL